VKAVLKESTRPIKWWMETLVDEEQLGKSKNNIKIYS
jgi:hypothetical protein